MNDIEYYNILIKQYDGKPDDFLSFLDSLDNKWDKKILIEYWNKKYSKNLKSLSLLEIFEKSSRKHNSNFIRYCWTNDLFQEEFESLDDMYCLAYWIGCYDASFYGEFKDQIEKLIRFSILRYGKKAFDDHESELLALFRIISSDMSLKVRFLGKKSELYYKDFSQLDFSMSRPWGEFIDSAFAYYCRKNWLDIKSNCLKDVQTDSYILDVNISLPSFSYQKIETVSVTDNYVENFSSSLDRKKIDYIKHQITCGLDLMGTSHFDFKRLLNDYSSFIEKIQDNSNVAKGPSIYPDEVVFDNAGKWKVCLSIESIRNFIHPTMNGENYQLNILELVDSLVNDDMNFLEPYVVKIKKEMDFLNKILGIDYVLDGELLRQELMSKILKYIDSPIMEIKSESSVSTILEQKILEWSNRDSNEILVKPKIDKLFRKPNNAELGETIYSEEKNKTIKLCLVRKEITLRLEVTGLFGDYYQDIFEFIPLQIEHLIQNYNQEKNLNKSERVELIDAHREATMYLSRNKNVNNEFVKNMVDKVRDDKRVIEKICRELNIKL